MKFSTKLIITLILSICIAAIIGAGAFIGNYCYSYYQSDCVYDDLQDLAIGIPKEDLLDSFPENPSASVPIINFDSLKAINPDIVGWIYVPDTRINYPIVKRLNDNDYYLSHLFDGTVNKSGSIFLDTRCNFEDQHILVHGHNMGNGSMFRDLELFKNRQFFQDHPYFFLFTPGQNFIVELFAGSIVRIDSPVWQLNFSGPSDIQDWLLDCRMAASVSRNLDVNPDSHVVTLSTCTYEYKQARWILQGVVSPLQDADAYNVQKFLLPLSD